MTRRLLLLAVLLAGCATSPAPAPKPVPDQALFDEIARMDRALFDAFNAHDLEGVMAHFADDLEMYHDTGGVLAREHARAGMKSNFDKNNGLRRDLVPGSMKVHPIRDYGAIQLGAHRFCHVEKGKDDCGVFEFAHVWRKRDGKWQITRALSYGH